jgi:hypothetical protein
MRSNAAENLEREATMIDAGYLDANIDRSAAVAFIAAAIRIFFFFPVFITAALVGFFGFGCGRNGIR